MRKPSSSYCDSFEKIDRFLTRFQPLWRDKPFDFLELPWKEEFPTLCEWLNSQKLDTLAEWKQNSHCLAREIEQWIPELVETMESTSWPLSTKDKVYPDNHLSTGIPGRKWQQINAFTESLTAEGENWLEWCGGKGFLGRLITQRTNAKVTTLEWQQSLCDQGADYAKQHQLKMDFVQSDAFSADSQQWVKDCDHAVALHACGDLHVTLINHATTAKIPAVSISPCCYHLIQAKVYQPLSEPARGSQLVLSKDDLKLPLQETVTAGNTVRNKRFIEVSFRLGFDLLQRSLLNTDTYLAVPSIKKSLLNEGFEAFCLWAATEKGLSLPENTDFQSFLSKGEKRFYVVEQMETVRTVFRRLLESWLVLDRAMYLQQMGYHVEIGEFCHRSLTPRNILIQARLYP
ncbi:methyltransferase [Veronia pacifica]|uniref:SAM-dependent methyltransferase n=1 Tax=Veronia pacifica TaxID=1080227 RepID=A0A1C3EM16_9GAMM|nr:methyltransferase [Veronia pacifica]ODA34293.1 SAM-dependent methyltransferase [Veronia pacifica]